MTYSEVKVERPRGDLVRLAVHGGFLQVDTSPGAAAGLAEGDGPLPGLSTRVTVLAGVAELAAEIDVARAEQARERAAQRVGELGAGRGPVSEDVEEDVELAEAEGALARAELRVAVATDGRLATAGGRTAGPRRNRPNEMELNSASLASAWLAWILRSVPDFERMTSDCVVAPNSWYCAPWTSSPSVMPVPTKSSCSPAPGRRSSARHRARSRLPAQQPAAPRPAGRAALISPPMHLRAAAASTPSGVPPMPKRMPAPAPGQPVAMAPASPSEIRRMRAPVARTSATRASWRAGPGSPPSGRGQAAPGARRGAWRYSVGARRCRGALRPGPTASFSM